ncbi:MAG: trypsin-like peptidase domain-containing protein [Gemmataceae bacterium]|nr:trypsin-like peptidase domain-containing protein [Gemmataceae bacterium]MCI0739168.1 trypsin-like peptidase domain-containing protein [Gemmataceae bacterium]
MKRWMIPATALLFVFSLIGFFAGTLLHGQATPGTAIPKELVSYRDIVKKVLPAVVSIETKAKPIAVSGKRQQTPLPDDPRIPEEFRRFFEEFRNMPEMPQTPRQGFGSGFFVDPSGVVLTNYHVVEGAEQVTVNLHDGRKFVSKNIRGDRRTDLAVILLEAKGSFPYLQLGDSDAMEIGDRVLAVGAPFGLAGSVTHGIVSAKGRSGLVGNMYEDFLQTDAAINPGNSGGPLVNLEGKVVGINSAIKSRSGGFQGVGLAIASNMADKVVKALRSDGVVRRGYLGVQIRELSDEVAERLSLAKDVGVVVGEVFDKTPAAKAGIHPGDIIVAIGGKDIKDGRALQSVVADLPLNKSVAVKLVRDQQPVTVQVTIEEQPAEFGSAQVPAPRGAQVMPESIAVKSIGVELADLTEELASDLGFRKDTAGALITRVQPNSAAAEAGLRRGMVITRVENQRVASATAALQAVEAASLAKGVLLQVQTPTGGVNFVIVRADA